MKFHWKPKLGVHSLVWDEANELAGRDPDFHRRDLYEMVESGIFPEYELGFQLVPETDELAFGFDLLDPTKIIPEDQVPVTPVGKMTLNRNPVNFFTETEQAAFHLGHVVPGIDFSNDPLLQGRLFSYLDTQINRFNGTNFQQLPINQTKAPVNNYQQDGYMRIANRPGKVNYEPNSHGCQPGAGSEAGRGRLRELPGADGRHQGALAQRNLWRPLQPGDALLQQHVGAGEAAHHAGSAV